MNRAASVLEMKRPFVRMAIWSLVQSMKNVRNGTTPAIISAPHTHTAHKIVGPGWRFLQPNLGDFLGGMDVVRKASRTLLKALDLPANRLNSLLNRRSVDWKFFRKAHRFSVERVTQQADQPDACEHNASRRHT